MKSSRVRKVTAFLSVVLVGWFSLFSPAGVEAEPVRLDLIPSLRLQEGYESNVTDVPFNEIGSFNTRIAPSLALKMTTVENITFTVAGSYEKVWYHDKEADDEDYDTWSFRVDSTGAWRFTPNFSMTPSVYFINTQESLARSEFLPASDPILPPTSVVNYGNTERQSFGGALDFQYLASPKVTTGVRVSYAEERYKNVDNTAVLDPTDDSQWGIRGSVSYGFSPVTSAGLYARVNFLNFENEEDSDVYSLGVSLNHRFSPVLKLFTELGASHIVRDVPTGTGSKDEETNLTGSFQLQYDGEVVTTTLYGFAAYSGLSGTGDATFEYRGGIGFSARLARDLTGSINGYYQHSEDAYQEESVDVETLFASATLTYHPWQRVSIYLRGSMENQRWGGKPLGNDRKLCSESRGYDI